MAGSAILIRLAAAAFALGALTAEDTAPAPAPAPTEAAPPAPKPPEWAGTWVPATGSLAKQTWGPGGIGTLVVVPTTSELVAAIDGAGLWSSEDGGETWKPLGQQEKGVAARPCRILIDPEHPESWWIAGGGSPGIFATSDGGATIRHLGAIDDARDLDVDFTDPKRELMLAGRRGKERGLERSAHGGSAWSKAGAKLPDKTDPPEHPLIIDAKTWLVATEGELKGCEPGIFLTEDAGATWRKVFSKGANLPAFALGKRSYLWPTADGGLGLTKDGGRTWTVPVGPGSAPLITVPGGWIAGIAGTRVQVSNDGGRSWSAVGPELPLAADGLAYLPKRHAFFAWHAGATAAPDAIVRMEVPEDLATAARPPVARAIVIWDGDELDQGYGWVSPKDPPNEVKVQHEVVRVGRGALIYRCAKTGWANFGWILDHAKMPKVDPAVCKGFVFAIKVDGDKKPSDIAVRISEKSVSILHYCPDAIDGAWHDVVVPLADLDDGKIDWTKWANFRFDMGGNGSEFDFSLYLDEIGFTDK
jgi:photosystem II stability/assembly factor-like uncharacterized protein